MTKTEKAIFKASGKAFQPIKALMAKYGRDEALAAVAVIMETFPGQRMRVYGREAGGIGPI